MGNRFPFGMRHRIHRTVTTGQGPLSITNSTALAGGTVNSTYSAQLDSTGGSGTYSPGYTLVAGSLPAGITLSTNGLLSGTPSTTGDSTFTIHVEDDGGSTARKAFKQTNVSSAVGMHSYFDSLSTRADTYLSASLRSDTNIDSYKVGSTENFDNWRYDSTVDAARGFTISSSNNDADIFPQLRFQFDPAFSSGSFTVIWDSYKGTDWRDNPNPPRKTYMVRNSSQGIHFEMREHTISGINFAAHTPVGNSTTDAALADIRVYKALSTVADSFASSGWYKSRDNSTGGIRTAANSDSVQPQHQSVWIPHSEWYRHVVHCEMSSATHGTDFDKWTKWIIRQGDGSTTVIEKMPLVNAGAKFFAMHYDNSATDTNVTTVWERNVWVGRDLSTSDVAGLLSTESL